ncbi:MAG: lysyl oxidase family protein [Solirubrobacteraceae bacterium]
MAVAVLAANAADAVAATPSKLAVTSTAGQPDAGLPSLWSGTVLSDGPRIRRIPECRRVSCDHVRLRVTLPPKLWKQRPGGVHVALRFIDGTPDDNLALAVYSRGVRVGASTAQVGTAQSVLIRSAENGIYDVYVVDGLAFGAPAPSPVIAYEGLAQVVYDPAQRPLRDLLPDLVALPQKNVTFGPPFQIFDDPVPEGSSCHASEIEESAAAECLRFDQVLGNIGAGPLDVRFDQPAGSVPVDDQAIAVRQRIRRSDGTSRDVASGDVIWHAIHGHYHLDGFAQSSLWATDADGDRAGAAPAATGAKVSFCIATTSINPLYWAQRAFGPDDYPAPDCLAPESTSGGLDHYKQGMSVGWTDEYNWFLPGQYVEVSGVGDGDYILDTTVDPTDRLIESAQSNNCGAVRVRLTSMGTDEPQAELLGPGPACED